MSKHRHSGGISFSKLVDYKSGNLAAFLLALVYIFFPWFTSGILDEKMVIFGLVFLTIAIMRAKPSNSVIGGMCQAFIAVGYIFGIAGLMNLAEVWILALVLTVLFFIFEFDFVKFGPTNKQADAFQIVPFSLLGFGLLVSFLGYGSLYTISFSNGWIALQYAAVMLFSFVCAFQIAGWDVTGSEKGTNRLILLLALAAIALIVLGVYQGQGIAFQWLARVLFR